MNESTTCRYRWLAWVVAIILPALAVAAPDPGDEVVATQGGASLSLADVDAFAGTIPAAQRAAIFASPQKVESVIRNLLAQKQLLQEARQLKLDQNPAVVEVMRRAADAALVQARQDALKAEAEAKVPDMTELARERYLANPDAFAVPSSVDVQHILISTKERSDDEARALAEKIHVALQKDPDSFDADVDKYSDDPGKTDGHGLIPDATSKRYVPEFREAATGLKRVGDMSAPVKSQFGYHILKLVKVTPARTRSFDEVKDGLVSKLRSDWVARTVRDHIDGVRSRELTPDMDLVKSLTTRYADATDTGAAQ